MAIGDKKTTDHINGFKKEIDKASEGDLNRFFNWFDESDGDIDTNFIKGQCGFTLYILMPLLNIFKDFKNKTALEIGYGGGRLLAGATQYFKEVIGIDIHNNASIVEAELKRQNINNYKLLQNDGRSIPMEASSVDLVYSFIVLQHVEKIDIFHSYVEETHRVLKKGGLAVLFFGRLYQMSSNTESKILYKIDRFIEKFNSKGYAEIFAKVNYTNLKISLDYAKKQSKRVGFSILDEGVSRKLPHLIKYGGQHFLVLKK